ncbi:hypothetical protein [Kribbella ginsengisoli]|uniref:hypothetical protein n=1 Tax=Kribbella ginsengisoli TaxID=363865 RepID=UPI0031D1E187
MKVMLRGAVLVACGLSMVVGSSGSASTVSAAPPVSAAERVLLRSAEERLIHDCMAAAGFKYFEKPVVAESGQPDFPYVVDDVAWARANGYGAGPVAPAVDPAGRYFAGLSREQQDAWRLALVGSGRQLSVELGPGRRLSASSTGCIASARRTLYGDLARWFKARRLTDNLGLLVQDRVRRDPRYLAAMAEWAGCVKGRGYDADDPGELREVVAARNEGLAAPVVRAAEVSATVAEAMCAQSTSLVRTLREVEPGYRAALIAERWSELVGLNGLEQDAVPRANVALGNR